MLWGPEAMSCVADKAAAGATSMRWWRHGLAALAVLACLVAGLAGGRALWARWQAARLLRRGAVYGTAALASGSGVDWRAVNVALEQHADEQALGRSLDLLVAGGFHTVRQRFPWAEIEPVRGEYRWEVWDAIVRDCRGRGLEIIAVLDGSPAWARAPEDADNPLAPPRNPADLATFARALALRYGESIDRYQVWDQPNIHPHWGERDPSPEGYLRLLQAARTQILDVDPGALLVCAGLAPTTEEEGRNLSEVSFLRGLYAAGGRDLFEVVAAKPFGFWSGPEDRCVDRAVLNYSRLLLLREEMVRHGDGDKPVWAVAWGWNALPAGWEGRPSPWGSDAAWRQHGRDERAIERARQEWPWLELMCYAAWQPAAPAEDPIWGLALLDVEGKPGPLYYRFRRLAAEAQTLYPGRHTLPAAEEVEIAFWGSRLDLDGAGQWQLTELDGQPLGRPVRAGRGLRTVVHGLAPGEHRLVLTGDRAGGELRVAVGRERQPWLPWREAAALAVATLLAAGGLWLLLRPYPWRRWWRAALVAFRRLSPWAAFGVGLAALGMLAVAPGLGASLAALALLALAVAARPDLGLLLAVFLVPLAPLQKPFGPARFSYLEVVTLLTVGAWAGREALAAVRRWREERRLGLPSWGELRRLNSLDVGLALLLAASGISLLAADNLRVSLRELRVVILQAAVIYWLVSRSRLDRAGLLRLADALVLSAVVVSLQGLYQYFCTEGVIVAEGVRRMRGIYGSPNNLALVLGRVFPVLLAMALCGPPGRRRRLYGLAALPAAACLFLTFSKGAWLFGVPASLLALGLLGGRRARTAVICLAIVGGLVLVPFLSTARLGGLFSLQGTSLFRLKLWEAAWEMACDHPWLGVGLDNFLYHYPHYIRPEAMSDPNLSHPHNIVLDFWLRLGLPGLLALGWLQWGFFGPALGLWRRRSHPEVWALTIGLLGAMADMLAHGMVDAAFFVVELAGIWALAAGLVRRLAEIDGSGCEQVPADRR